MTTSPAVPLLVAGECLARDEFERRYSAMPDLKKAELVERVVYMASPVRRIQHGEPHPMLGFWLGCRRTAEHEAFAARVAAGS